MEEVRTLDAPQPIGPYSQAVKSRGFIFCAGQIPLDPKTGQIVEGGIEEQTRRVLLNIQSILRAGGTDLNKVVKATVFLTDLDDFQGFNRVYSEFFQPPYPARTTVQVARLPRGSRIEIEVIAEI
jgi:2-iminobutanoate/2-iminopropanoate deaminase